RVVFLYRLRNAVRGLFFPSSGENAGAPTPGQPTGVPMASAASRGVGPSGQCAAIIRRPLNPSDSAEARNRMGAAITSGLNRTERSGALSCVTMPVSVGPPGVTTLTVIPLPSSPSAQIADIDSSAALDEP